MYNNNIGHNLLRADNIVYPHEMLVRPMACEVTQPLALIPILPLTSCAHLSKSLNHFESLFIYISDVNNITFVGLL